MSTEKKKKETALTEELTNNLKGLCDFFSSEDWPKMEIPLEVKHNMGNAFPFNCSIVFGIPASLQFWLSRSRQLLQKIEAMKVAETKP